MAATLPHFTPGTELTAELLNRIVLFIRRQGSLRAAPPLYVDEQPDGAVVRLEQDTRLWAILTDRSGGFYGWAEAVPHPDGSFVVRPGGRTGGCGSGDYGDAAVEAGGLPASVGDVVLLREEQVGVRRRLVFDAPARRTLPARSLFWARLTAESSRTPGDYGYVEVGWNGRRLLDTIDGRSSTPDAPPAAREVSGRTGLSADAVVLLHDASCGRASAATDDADAAAGYGGRGEAAVAGDVTFAARTASAAGFGTPAILTPWSAGRLWRLSLGGATSGWFTLGVTDHDVVSPAGLPPETRVTGRVAFGASPRVLRKAIEAVLFAGCCRVAAVAGGDEGAAGYAVSFVTGGRRIAVGIDGSRLYDGGGVVVSAGATASLIREGVEHPHPVPPPASAGAAGKAGYGWVAASSEAAGVSGESSLFVPADGAPWDAPASATAAGAFAGADDGGTAFAYEASGDDTQPVGAVVRLGTTEDGRVRFARSEESCWAATGLLTARVVDLASPDYGRPTAGLWLLRVGEGDPADGAVPGVTPVVGTLSLQASAPGTSFVLTWQQPHPVRTPDGLGGFARAVVQPAAAVAAGCTAAQLTATLAGLSRVLSGNVSVSGGPLGTQPLVVSFVNELLHVPLADFVVSSVSSGTASRTHVLGSGGASTRLMAYDVALSSSTPFTYTSVRSCVGEPLLRVGTRGCAVRSLSLAADATAATAAMEIAETGSFGDPPAVAAPWLLRAWLGYGAAGTTLGTPAGAASAVTPLPPASAAPASAARLPVVAVVGVSSSLYSPAFAAGRYFPLLAAEASGERTPAGELVRVCAARRYAAGTPSPAAAATSPVGRERVFRRSSGVVRGSVVAGDGAGNYLLAKQAPGAFPQAYLAAAEASGYARVPSGTAVEAYPVPGGYRFFYDVGRRMRVLRVRAAGWSVAAETSDASLVPDDVPVRLEVGHDLVVGAYACGLPVEQASETDDGLDVYRVQSRLPDAAQGVAGGVGLSNQFLGAGTKTLGGLAMEVVADGEHQPIDGMPGSSYLVCSSFGSSGFFGMRSGDGAAFFGVTLAGDNLGDASAYGGGYPAGATAVGSPLYRMATSAQAYAVNGQMGGDDVVEAVGPFGGATLTFAGGLLEDVAYDFTHPATLYSGSLAAVLVAPGDGRFVVFDGGLVYGRTG